MCKYTILSITLLNFLFEYLHLSPSKRLFQQTALFFELLAQSISFSVSHNVNSIIMTIYNPTCVVQQYFPPLFMLRRDIQRYAHLLCSNIGKVLSKFVAYMFTPDALRIQFPVTQPSCIRWNREISIYDRHVYIC